jgi:hypothetical protein
VRDASYLVSVGNFSAMTFLHRGELSGIATSQAQTGFTGNITLAATTLPKAALLTHVAG